MPGDGGLKLQDVEISARFGTDKIVTGGGTEREIDGGYARPIATMRVSNYKSALGNAAHEFIRLCKPKPGHYVARGAQYSDDDVGYLLFEVRYAEAVITINGREEVYPRIGNRVNWCYPGEPAGEVVWQRDHERHWKDQKKFEVSSQGQYPKSIQIQGGEIYLTLDNDDVPPGMPEVAEAIATLLSPYAGFLDEIIQGACAEHNAQVEAEEAELELELREDHPA